MTREDAITNLEMIRLAYIEPVTELQRKIIDDTFDMAIKALEQEPCEDAISRQAVLEQINCWIGSGEYRYTNATDYLNKRITNLPSVSTEKTGRWITQWNPAHQKEYYYCSECREEYSYDGEIGIKMNNYKFCPNCGCRMMEVEE